MHLKAGGLPLNRTLVRIDVPDDVWDARIRMLADELPIGWDAVPESKVSLDVGDAWLKGAGAVLLEVPSAIVVEERVFVINPRHPAAAAVTAFKARRWTYDARLRPET